MTRISPARASLHRRLAAQAAGASTTGAPARPEDAPGASEYRLLLAALGIDLNALRNIQSRERKIEAKREMIEKYRTWVIAAATEGAGVQDEIVSTIMIWAIDLHDWHLATVLAGYVLKEGLKLPERYNRTAATLIAEEFAEAEIAAPGTVPHDVLAAIADLVESEDIFDQVRAKLEKAIGLSYNYRAELFEETAESAVAGGKRALLAAALSCFERADSLDRRSHVRKLMDGIRKALKKAAPDPAQK